MTEQHEGPVETDHLGTGHADVDAAVAQLDQLDQLDLAQHPEHFDAIHQVLREALANASRDAGPVTSI